MRVPIARCSAAPCAYNSHGTCYAVSIEISRDDARCESFTRSVMFNVTPHFSSQVTLCRMSGCANNRLSSCTRENIVIESTNNGGICCDFVARNMESSNNK